ncbi:efflux RND transporter periplasmic adaptor subunit [Dyadobacter tibetensis]|uniref:efflux RND transporter periplasmic adaptor subunit n=1 Tax=Dyadobacter tibetensis TaxID=1211851 RepID=UPI00047189DB|nr:efflux RND transporter periplasmic adaptor subunit [Dyadobacter tibetensis]
MKNLIIIFLLVSAGFSCSSPQEDNKESQETDQHDDLENNRIEVSEADLLTAKIVTSNLQQKNLSNVVNANGAIDIPPQNRVSISAPMGGFIRKTDLLEGMKVRKGQVLAVIENPEFIPIQQEYLEVSSQLEYAQMDLERQKALSAEQVNALKTYQQAQTTVKTLLARKAGLAERITTAGLSLSTVQKGSIVNNAVVRSPISGTVTTVNVNIGMYVAPTDVIFEIVDTDHLHIELSVFERDINKIKPGQKVRFTLSNQPETEYLAKVYLINQMIDEDRTVRVHCHLDTELKGLLPQNFVKASIELEGQKSWALPDPAIVNFEGKFYIFAETDSSANTHDGVKESHGTSFEMIEVQKGTSADGFTAIDLPADSNVSTRKVVTTGAYTLLSMMKNTESGHHH